MSFFVSQAMAANADAVSTSAQNMGNASSLMMIAGIFILFYFMLIRPQNKRAKEHKEMLGQIKKGDEVVTVGGMLGKVVALDEQFIKINIAEGIDIHLQRHSISSILPKGTLKSIQG